MKGNTYYCGSCKTFVHAKIGVVTVLADAPEKAFILKTSLLGHHGRIAYCAADTKLDIMADCKKCFKNRLLSVFNHRHSHSNMNICHNFCQWDLNSTSVSLK